MLQVFNASGTAVATSAAGASSLSWSLPAGGDGAYYARVTAAGGTSGLLSQYMLSLDVVNTTPPQITSVSLPGEGTTSQAVVDRFTVGLSTDMDASTVNDVSNLELRSAGADGVFGTADDQVYALTSYGYTSGLSVSYRITDGPLQAGTYRLTIGTGLKDRLGNPMAASYVRNFTMAGLATYILENQNNDWTGIATPLSPNPTNTLDGTYYYAGGRGTGSSPYFVVSGLLNGDSYLDLVTANYNSNTVSVSLGNGDGSFQAAVSYAVGSNPVAATLGDFNGDGRLDLAAADYNGSNVSILLGNGDRDLCRCRQLPGGFQARPHCGGRLERGWEAGLVVANYGNSFVSVLLGNGDGTFRAAANYTAGSNAGDAAAGDLDGDGKLDLAVANYGSNDVSILHGNGDGTFSAPVNYAAGSGPRTIAMGDFSGDGKLESGRGRQQWERSGAAEQGRWHVRRAGQLPRWGQQRLPGDRP